MSFDVSAVSESSAESMVPQRISRFALQQRSRIEQHERDEGTKRLMWAMLKDTLRCYQAYGGAKNPRSQRLFYDAERWIRSRDQKWTFSYENVCAVLGIDSEYLRNELHRRARAQKSNVQFVRTEE